MTKQDFINLLTEELEIESIKLEETTELKSIDEWDSMAIMVVIGLLDDKFGQKATAEDFENIDSVGSIIKLIGDKNFS